MSRRLFTIVLMMFVVALLPVAATAQDGTSTGNGVVHDSQGGAIPGATIPLVNEPTAQGSPAAEANVGQVPAPAPRPQTLTEPPALPQVAAGQDGFAIQSPNGDFRLQIGLLVHADGRFAPDDADQQVVDTFAFRRLRPYLRGRFSRRFEFYFNPDFAGGTLVIQDAYVDTIFSPAFRVRAGKGKTPFGLEGCIRPPTCCSSTVRCRLPSFRTVISESRCWATSRAAWSVIWPAS